MKRRQNDDYLQHFGILGMKWGVRRYQNEDGTWTSEGKKRRRLNYSEDYNRTHDNREYSELSNKELDERLARYRKEKEYSKFQKEFSSNPRREKLIKIGATVVASLLLLPLKEVVKDRMKNTYNKGIDKVLRKLTR